MPTDFAFYRLPVGILTVRRALITWCQAKHDVHRKPGVSAIEEVIWGISCRFTPRTVICMYNFGQGALPVWYGFNCQISKHGKECSIKSLRLTVSSCVVRCCAWALNATVFFQLGKELVLELNYTQAYVYTMRKAHILILNNRILWVLSQKRRGKFVYV